MTTTNSLPAGFFDSLNTNKGNFKFSKPKTPYEKDLKPPFSLASHLKCKSLTSMYRKEGNFALNGHLLVRFRTKIMRLFGSKQGQEEYSTKVQKVLDISYARLQPLAPNSASSEYGFTLTKNDHSFAFYCDDEETMENWMTVLKTVCVLTNFHDEYKVLKAIGRGSFAKVK